jgi:23S rRNA G2445 N2-methylase RlmL
MWFSVGMERVKPMPMTTISDPACGTGGFLLAAFEYLRERSSGERENRHLRSKALVGIDLVPNVARLCAMNLFLHGIGLDAKHPVVSIGDSLESSPTQVDMVLTNPPFGKKSSFTIIGADGRSKTDKISYQRSDFWATTSNKQLNFVQHVFSMLKVGGRAAVVIPDNVLFEAVRASGLDGNYYGNATFTRYCACRLEFGIPPVSRLTFCSSIKSLKLRSRLQPDFGSTISGRTKGFLFGTIRSKPKISATSLPAIVLTM